MLCQKDGRRVLGLGNQSADGEATRHVLEDQQESGIPAATRRQQPSRGWIILVSAFFLVWAVRATVLYSIDLSIPPGALRQIYADTIRIALWVLPVFIYLRFVDKVDSLRYLKLNTHIETRALLQSIVLIAAYMVAAVLLDYWLRGRTLFHSVRSERLLQIALALPCAPVAEEILFRGFLLRKLRAYLGFWKANVSTALLFTIIHWPNWLYTGGLRKEVAVNSISIFLLGCFFGYLARKTGSLWPAIAAHTLNNLISFLLIRL